MVVDAERQFALLTDLLELARSQGHALEDGDFHRFENLMDERVQVMGEIQGLWQTSESLPDNVLPLQTPYRIGHEVDTTAATDLVIRLILDQDAMNEHLLIELLGAAAVAA